MLRSLTLLAACAAALATLAQTTYTQTLPTMPGHPGGNAPQYHPPNSGGAVGYLMGWHVVVI